MAREMEARIELRFLSHRTYERVEIDPAAERISPVPAASTPTE